MTLEPLSGDLRAFAEDPGAFVAIGPDEERILTDRYSVTFTPGEHFWSASVQRLRFGVGDVAGGVAEIRGLVTDRGRNAAAWTVGPSATPDGLLELLLAMGMKSESDEGSLMLVLTEPPHAQASPFEVRLVTSYEDHLAAIEVANQGFAFPSEDALDERRRARASFQSERAGGHSVRLLVVDDGRPVAAGRAWRSPFGLYLGGGATVPSDRRRGAMSALVARAWKEAVDRGTPTLVTLGGAMAAAGLQRIGFRAVGRVWHLVDRIDG
jgi:GNAT superfamily N-acetyltransferase